MAGIFSSDKKKKEEESRQGSSSSIFGTQKQSITKQTTTQPKQQTTSLKGASGRDSISSGAGSNRLSNPAGRDTVSITGIANDFIKQNNMAYARGDLNRNSWATAYKAISDRLKSETNDKNKANHDALLKTMQAQGRKFFSEDTFPTFGSSPIKYEMMTPEKYQGNIGTHPIGQRSDQNYLLNPQMMNDPASALKNPNTTWGKLYGIANQKAENEKKFLDNAYQIANGAPMSGWSDRDIRLNQNMWNKMSEDYQNRAEQWTLNHPSGENADPNVIIANAEADKRNEIMSRPDYEGYFTDQHMMEIEDAKNQALADAKEPKQMPAAWQNTGVFGTAGNMASYEMGRRDFQRKYVGNTLAEDWESKSQYKPATVTKDLTKLEASNPETLAEQQASMWNKPEIMEEYQNIRHEAINGDQDAVYYLTHVREAGAQNDEYSEDPFVEQYMTDEERQQYNYLWGDGTEEERAAAQEFVDGLNIELWRRAWTAADEATRARLESMPGWALVLESGIMAGIGLIENQANAVLAAEDVLSGRPINPWRMSNIATTTNEVTDTRIRDWADRNGLGEIGQNALSMIYQGAYSGIQSGLSIGFGGLTANALGMTGKVFNEATKYFSLGLMSSGAGSQTLQTELMQGVPQDRAILDAIAAGGIEFATEMIGMDNLFNGNWGGKSGFVTFLKQALAEGSEELVGDIASDAFGMIADIIDNTNYSELNRQANAYILENGLAPDDRDKVMAQILTERLSDYAVDFGVGSVSTVFGEGSIGAMQAYTNASAISSHVSPMQAESVWNYALENLPEDSVAYKRAAEVKDKFNTGAYLNDERGFAKDVRKMSRGVVYEVQSIENNEERKEAFNTMLGAFGMQYILTPDVQRSEPENVTGNDTISNDAVEAASRAEQVAKDNQFVHNAVSLAIAAQANMTEPMQPDEVERTIDSFVKGEGTPDLSNTGLGDDTIAELNNIAERRQMTEVMDDIVNEGNTVKPSPESTETAPEVQAEETPTEELASGAGQDTVTKQTEIKPSYYNTLSDEGKRAYNQVMNEARARNMPEAEAQTAFQMLYDAGTSQIPYLPTRGIRSLSEWTRNSVYGLGYQESLQEAKGIQTRGFTKTIAAGVARTSVVTDAIKAGTISNKTISVMDRIGKMMGVSVNLMPTMKNNGEYRVGGNTINIALDSWFLGKGRANTDAAVLGTFGHELTHRLQDVSADLYRQFSDQVAKLMGSRDFSAKVARVMQRESNLTPIQAQAEVIANFVGMNMFEDASFADKFLDGITANTAEQRTALQGIRDFVQKVLSWIRGNRNALKNAKQTEEIFQNLETSLTNLIEQSAKTIKTAGTVVETIDSNPGYEGGFQNSVRATFEYAGIDAVMDSETGEISYTYDGKKVDHVTPEHIQSSGIGAMIKLAEQKKYITKDAAKSQYQAFADILNMVMSTQNADMIWQFVGSEVFSAVKSNSDNQYGTTVDMSTICKKTQDMITAMSAAMVAAKRGLTIKEVTDLQNKINQNGMQVPCPVCYVFSRWAGIGSVLDQMYNYQKKYPLGMSMSEIQAAYDQLTKEKAKDRKARLMEEDASYRDLVEIRKEERANKKKINADIKAAQKEGNTAEVARLQAAKEQSEKLIKEYSRMIAEMENTSSEASWLKNTRMNEAYEKEGPVPPEILFDLDAGAVLARDYSSSWRYRVTRGAGKGKAILPYSDFRFGALIDGPKNAGRLLENGKDILHTGEFTKDQMKLIESAILRTKAQNLIGGQRYQSTSDFRYDYALDYLMSFLEAQALGSNIQTYTKVVEYAELIAAVGGDVNLSVMPLERGYDDNGKLIYSSVTGINYDAAVKASQLYDSAQLILVGINDRHIELALMDPNIGFVIPWHASGASNDFTQSLLKNLGEDYNADYYQNYEAVQEDHEKKNRTADQEYRSDLRMRILTGAELTQEDIAYLENLNTSEDISDMSFEELRDIEQHALRGNKEAMETYLSWSDGILYDLYQKMTSDEYKGVKLKKSQAASVMPHEYWNTGSTLDNAYVNGFIFRSYCESLGLHPRFTGRNSNGKMVSFGDFSGSEGYWKTLIDRPMYDNAGNYRAQKAINLNQFQKEMLNPEHRNVLWGDYATNMPETDKARRVGTEYGKSLNGDVRNSARDSEGNTLTENQQEFFKDSQVRDENGNLLIMYHGTRTGGFTIFNPQYSDDKRSLFFSSNRKVASSYTREFNDVEDFREGGNKVTVYPVYLNITNPLIVDAKGATWSAIQNGGVEAFTAERHQIGDYTFLSQEDLDKFNEQYDLSGLQAAYQEALENGYAEYNGEEYEDYELQNMIERLENKYLQYFRNNSKPITLREFLDNAENYGWYDLLSLQERYDANGPSLLEIKEYANDDYQTAVDQYREHFADQIAEGNLDEDIYDTLEFGVMAQNGEEVTKRDLHNTRWYAQQAQEAGHDGVIFKNLYDSVGGAGGASTVAIAFDSNQVKLTSNENPTEDKDIRYSARDENAVNDYADIIARNQQREQARALLGNPASWRHSNVKLDAIGLRKKTLGMLDQFGDLISANQREKVVKDVAKLANDMLHGRETDLYDIEMKAANIASDVVFFSYGAEDTAARDAMMDDPAAEAAVDNITDYILANISGTQSYQARNLQKQIEQNKKLKDTLKTVREKRDTEIRRRIEAGKERQRARQDSELRKSILKRGKRLEGMKMFDANKALKEQLIGGMNLDVTHLTDGQKNNITELLAWAAEQEQNSDFVMSESVRKQLSMVNQTYLDDIISKDDPDAINKLRLLNEALKELEHAIRTQNRLIDDADNRELREIAYDEDEILNNVNGTTEGWKRNIDKIFVQGTLSPMRFMHRLTGYVERSGLYRLAKAIDEGGIKKLAYQSRAVQMFDKWMSDKKLVRSWAGKNADIKTYDYIAPDGKEAHLELTPGMRMTLYLASKDYGWMRHMCGVDTPDGHLDGRGITLPKMSSYKKGKISYSGAETYRITRSILNKIIADMSAEERAFADKANEFFNGMQKDALNATSQQLIGRDIALVDDYLPITVDDRFLGKDYGTIKMDGTVEGIGSLKERVESGAPVFVRDLTDILMQSIESTSSYVGLAVPITNFNKLMKAKLGAVDANGVFRTGETTLKNTIDAKWGDTALNYIDKMIADIQHPNYVREDLDKAFAKIRSNYARSVLTLNLSVGLKQGASYPTAAAVVGWKALSKSFVNYKHVDIDLIRKYTPLLWYRSRGFVNPELGTIKNGSVWDNLPKGLDWITGIDFLTTRKLWKAAEYYVQDAQPGLYKPGAGIYGQSNEYYEAVAEVYNQVIEETQPNYTPWQRPQYLRSHSGITQTLMMFKTQPMQNFNVLYDAIGNYRAKVREMKINGQSREVQQAYKEAGKKLRWAITSQIGQLVTFAAMTMLWNIFRRKKEKYTDEDGNFSLEVLFQNMGKDIGSGVFGMIPFGSDAWSFISSKLFGDKYYGFESVTDSVIGDLWDSVGTAWDTMSNLLTSGEKFSLTTYKSKLKSVGTAVTKLFGIPAENVYNIMTALYKRGRDMTEDRYMADVYALAWDVDPEKNKKDFMNIAYRAYNNGDMESFEDVKDFYRTEWEWSDDTINENLRTLYASQFSDAPNPGVTPAYQNLYALYKTDEDAYLYEYNKMEELGFSEDQLKKGIESLMKEEAGVDSVNDLEERFTTPEEEIRKEEKLRPLHESKAWQDANEAERETLEDYADKFNNSDTKQWTVAREGVDAGALTFDEYMQFMLALTNVDQPTKSGKYGSYTIDEVKAAIDEMGWTSDQARELWQYLPKYNSNNPYETVQEEKKEPVLETIPEPEPEPEPEPASLSGSDLNAGDLKKIEKSEDTATPESSWISNIHYNPNTQTLTVTTKGGRTYTHSGVSKETYEDFKNAPSKGRWYNAHF